MTACALPVCDRAVGSLTDRFIFLVALSGGPRFSKGRDVHQIVGDDTEPDPTMHAVDAMVATTTQAVTTFEHTDAPFAPDAPALPAAEPALTFMGTPRRRLGAGPRQDHTSYAAVNRRLFIASRAETTVACGQIRRAAEDRLMPIQRRGPQRGVGRSPRGKFAG